MNSAVEQEFIAGSAMTRATTAQPARETGSEALGMTRKDSIIIVALATICAVAFLAIKVALN